MPGEISITSEYREESALLNKIQKWGVALGGGMIGTAAAMDYLPETKVTTHYSDGSSESHTESNGGNMIIAGIKICLLVIGLAIIAIVSTVIMIYSTIQGFRRNYNWGPLARILISQQNFRLPQGNLTAFSYCSFSKRQENSRKTSISALLTMPKPLTVWITINCGKF